MTRKPRTARRGGDTSSRNWRTIDLHLHTPASSDYQEPQVSYLDILKRAEARGLDAIAFTDHNSVAGYQRLKGDVEDLELLERLGRLLPAEKTRLAEYRRLLGKVLVLPGFEFTATFGFHILGLFPPETPARDLEHLLLSLNVPRDQLDRGSATVGATSDVLTAYRLIHEAGGLAIAAHANSSNGVAMRGFNFGGQTKIAYTQDPHLHALEVTDLDQKGNRSTAAFFNGTKPEYPRRMHCLQGSDAHRLARDPANAKNLGVGDRATDVLLDEVTFEALRDLFLGSDFAHLRPHTGHAEARTEVDFVQQAREEGPNIVQAFHESMTQRGGRLFAVIADVCAFANANGGTVYVGVPADPQAKLMGISNPKQAAQELQSAIDRMITPPPACTVDTVQSKGKPVIRVLVPRGDDPPYAIEDNKIYVREEAETSLAVRDEIVRLVLRRRVAGEAPEPVPAPSAAPIVSGETAQPAPSPATNAPRTGVEIISVEERDGVRYYALCDLRSGNTVTNVTRASARKLWHFAITSSEAGPVKPEAVTWHGDYGLWRRRRVAGAVRYDLVQRAGDRLRVFYGVTDDGVHGAWKQVVQPNGEE